MTPKKPKPQTQPKRPVPIPRPKPLPPIESGPDQILRDRRRLAIPVEDTRDVFEKVFGG